MSDPMARDFILREMEARGTTRDSSVATNPNAVLICCSVGDPMRVPSIVGSCDDCGSPIFWSKKAASIVRKLCMRCGAILIAKEKAKEAREAKGERVAFSTTTAIVDEVRRYFGKPDE